MSLGTFMQHGIDCTYAADSARKVIDVLEGGSELRPYQALWCYLAANATRRAESRSGKSSTGISEDLLRRAVAYAPNLSYFLKPLKEAAAITEEVDAITATAALNAARKLTRLGHIGSKFEKQMVALKKDLASTESSAFERGLDNLGELLGFETIPGVGQRKAAPDSVWHIEHELVLGLEAKSDEKADAPISISTVRETKGHLDWIRDELKLKSTRGATVVLTSPRTSIDKDAKKFADNLLYISVDGIAAVAKDVASALANVRRDAGNSSEPVIVDAIVR